MKNQVSVLSVMPSTARKSQAFQMPEQTLPCTQSGFYKLTIRSDLWFLLCLSKAEKTTWVKLLFVLLACWLVVLVSHCSNWTHTFIKHWKKQGPLCPLSLRRTQRTDCPLPPPLARSLPSNQAGLWKRSIPSPRLSRSRIFWFRKGASKAVEVLGTQGLLLLLLTECVLCEGRGLLLVSAVLSEARTEPLRPTGEAPWVFAEG